MTFLPPYLPEKGVKVTITTKASHTLPNIHSLLNGLVTVVTNIVDSFFNYVLPVIWNQHENTTKILRCEG